LVLVDVEDDDDEDEDEDDDEEEAIGGVSFVSKSFSLFSVATAEEVDDEFCCGIAFVVDGEEFATVICCCCCCCCIRRSLA